MTIMIIEAEFINLVGGVRHAVEISPSLGETAFVLDGVGSGVSIGCQDDPASAKLVSVAISPRRVSFKLSEDIPALTVRARIQTPFPLLFGRIATSDTTQVTMSNGTSGLSLLGPTYWILPADYWESPAIGALLSSDEGADPVVPAPPLREEGSNPANPRKPAAQTPSAGGPVP